MKKTPIIAAIVVALSGCAAMNAANQYNDSIWKLQNESLAQVSFMSTSMATFLTTGTEEDAIEKAKQAVTDRLRDPGSAQFKKVRIVPYHQGKVVCGEVNSKNAYGGYVGFTAFVAGIEQAALYSKDDQYPKIELAYNTGLVGACY